MMSVQNHRQQLSGNKLLVFWVIIFSLTSCSVSRKTSPLDDKNVQIIKSGTKKPVPDQIPMDTSIITRQLPKTDSSTGNVIKRDVKLEVKIDTIYWKSPVNVIPPITIKEKKKAIYKEGINLKDSYNVKFLIPLNSDAYNSSELSQSRFVHYYAGVLRALERLDDEQIKINITVIDTEEGSTKVKDRLSEIVTEDTDLILGPFERDDVKLMAEECKIKSIPLVSPWQTSTKITNENPYYIQMKPNLKEHFLKLAQNTCSEFQKGEVAIIGRNNKETNSWISYFQEASKTDLNSKNADFYTLVYVTDDSLNVGVMAFAKIMKNPKIKAVIIPNYSYNDEAFIYSCLRKLLAEKGSRPIIVYGMPILYESEKIDFDFYHSLQMRIVMSDFVDENQSDIREFRREYLDIYGEIPPADAIKGYDLMLYIGRNIWKYGKNFQNYLDSEAISYLQSTFDIKKAKSEDSMIDADPSKFDFFENKHLDIIEFKGTRFQRRN
ncbi:MAG: amino acid ABC transporter substrate-binding protein [Saprospiraceae bacterium]|nr:amino acid ABC transporter substrate-binding protein [Saprospiraceae bacterium]